MCVTGQLGQERKEPARPVTCSWGGLHYPPQFLWDRGHVGMGVKCLNAVYRAL